MDVNDVDFSNKIFTKPEDLLSDDPWDEVVGHCVSSVGLRETQCRNLPTFVFDGKWTPQIAINDRSAIDKGNPLFPHTPTQFGLLSIRDLETEDQSNVESGEEDVVALPGHIFVATRRDTDGEVSVEVHVGECYIPGVRFVFDGFMVFQSSFMCITGAADPDEETLSMPRAGKWGVKIYA